MDEEWVEYDGGVVQNRHRRARRIRVAPHVTVIPERAFDSWTNLRAVDLSNVATISASAFNGCSSLERVVLPTDSAIEIGEGAFYDCRSLQEIDLSNATKIGAEAFVSCEALRSVSTAAIGAQAFYGCANLTEVELSEGIQHIREGAFAYCRALVRITVPATITAIEANAFNGCTSLVELELNEGLQNIEESAFYRCASLQSINIPPSTIKVGSGAFYGCIQLRNAELREGLQMIGGQAFCDCRSLERITIPSSVKVVAVGAFGDCNNLTEVTLRDGVHCIDTGAFSECTSLDHISIPPVALVIDIERSSCQLMRTTMPATLESKLVVSKWMQYRCPEQLAQAEAKLDEILGRDEQTAEEKTAPIREWLAYFDLLDVTTMLELAIWRVNMDGSEQNAAARQARRENCGNDITVIIPGVLPFLDGQAC